MNLNIKESLKKIYPYKINEYWVSIILSSIIALIFQFFFYSNELIFSYRDAVSHLDNSRRFYDSLTPGMMAQLGIVWLPIPHLLTFPYTYFDILWKTGLAGSIVGFISFILTSGNAFRIGSLISDDKYTKWITFSIFVLNPNMLYFQTTGMTEPVFLLFLVTAFYFILRWSKSKLRYDLIGAGFFSALAMGCRYEGWFFTIIAGIAILYYYYKNGKSLFSGAFLYFSLPVSFALFWFGYNLFYYGDILAFQRGEYSSQAIMKPFEEAGNLPAKGYLFASINLFLRAVFSNNSILIVLLSFIGLGYYIYKNKFKNEAIFPIISFSLIIMGVISLYFGQVAIILPSSSPPGYFNSRYGLMLLPFIIYFTGYLYSLIIIDFNYKKIIAFLIIGLNLLWILGYPESAGSVAEAMYFDKIKPEYKKASEFLQKYYDGSNILSDDKIMTIYPFSNIPIRERIYEHTFEIGKHAIQRPSKYVGWILVDKTSSPPDGVWKLMSYNNDFKVNFTPVFFENGVEIYKRKIVPK